MKSYIDRVSERSKLMDNLYNRAMKIEDYARKNWQAINYLPNNEEIKYACNQLCIITKNEAKPAFDNNPELYDRFCKECDDIKKRFQKLDPERPVDATCGVYQVNHYLYEEAYDLISEALGLYVPNEYEEEY